MSPRDHRICRPPGAIRTLEARASVGVLAAAFGLLLSPGCERLAVDRRTTGMDDHRAPPPTTGRLPLRQGEARPRAPRSEMIEISPGASASAAGTATPASAQKEKRSSVLEPGGYRGRPCSYDRSRTHVRRRGGEALQRLHDGEGPTPATVTDRYTAWAAAHADASWAEDGRPTSLTLCGTFLRRPCHEPVAAERVELVRACRLCPPVSTGRAGVRLGNGGVTVLTAALPAGSPARTCARPSRAVPSSQLRAEKPHVRRTRLKGVARNCCSFRLAMQRMDGARKEP